MKLTTLIFDLDNTIIDRNAALKIAAGNWLDDQQFSGNKEAAITEIMLSDDWGYCDRTIFCSWLQMHYGKTRSVLQTPEELFQQLITGMIPSFKPVPEVIEQFTLLQKKYRLVLATNGGGNNQRSKLKNAGLTHFFAPDDIFISGEMGVAKPDKYFFEQIITRANINPAEAMMSGDFLINDIEPAQRCGLHTCWLSYGRKNTETIHPDYEIADITTLSDLLQFIEK